MGGGHRLLFVVVNFPYASRAYRPQAPRKHRNHQTTPLRGAANAARDAAERSNDTVSATEACCPGNALHILANRNAIVLCNAPLLSSDLRSKSAAHAALTGGIYTRTHDTC